MVTADSTEQLPSTNPAEEEHHIIFLFDLFIFSPFHFLSILYALCKTLWAPARKDAIEIKGIIIMIIEKPYRC